MMIEEQNVTIKYKQPRVTKVNYGVKKDGVGSEKKLAETEHLRLQMSKNECEAGISNELYTA